MAEPRHVVVTGGESGIGAAVVRAFAREGASVVIAGLASDRADEVVRYAESQGASARFVRCDVRHANEVAALFRELERVDILVNNAGLRVGGRVDEISDDGFDLCLDTNLRGTFFMSREVLPQMRQQGGGAIVNIASNAGLVARPDDPIYCAAKAAVIMLTKSMAIGHAQDKVRVNAVAPGPIDTPTMSHALERAADKQAKLEHILKQAPLAYVRARLITPDEVAHAVCYLASEGATMVTGAVLAIDGGKSAGQSPFLTGADL